MSTVSVRLLVQVTEEELAEIFDDCGKVQDCRVRFCCVVLLALEILAFVPPGPMEIEA